jgi:SAM-dependent methyltransferase
MSENLGQKSSIWDEWWGGITPISEIQMWDFYGGRQWISKYVPRFGKVVEAGCGVGRYVFYLKRLGIDVEGVDFSELIIERVDAIKSEIIPDAVFLHGDITNLLYNDNSLSGYISLGVVEHFIDDPEQALAEAYRVLRPGGIAIVTTPNISFLVSYRRFIIKMKNLLKRIVGKKIINQAFFQYEYRPKKLKKLLEEYGFFISRAEGCDLLYPFCEIGGFNGDNLKKGKFAYWFSSVFENSWIKNLGGQSITIAVKKAPLMYCFLSGELTATSESLDKFDVPISRKYQKTQLANLFIKKRKVKFSESYDINPPLLSPVKKKCAYSGTEYFTDPIFEDFGFNKNASPQMLIKPEVNIDLCVNHLKPVWRKRKINNY